MSRLSGKSALLVAIAVTVMLVRWPARFEGAVFKYNPTQRGDARADGPYTVGSLVRVGGVDRLVTHLGAQDADAAVDGQDPDGADGLTGFADDDGFFQGPIRVGLWSADGGTLLASVAVTSADPYIGSWRYAAIPGGPVTLRANTNYLVGAAVGGGIEWFIDGHSGGYSSATVAAADGFVLVGNRYAVGGSLAAPVNDGGGVLGRWGAANMMEIAEPPLTSLFTYDITQRAQARADGPYTVGTLFRVGSEGRVISHLGAQDADAAVDGQDPDGPDALTGFADDEGFFQGPIRVGLWTADGSTLLASVAVTSADMEIDSWRYAPIPGGPIRLNPNTDYLIGAAVGGGIEWFLDGAATGTVPFGPNDGITLLGNRYAVGGTLAAPVNDGGGVAGRWAVANAIFVPEPSTFLLAALGLLGLGLYGLRQKRK